MDNINIRPVNEIVYEFNTKIRKLLNQLERKLRVEEEVANIDRLKKRINLLKSAVGEAALVIECAPFFIDYSEKILNRDEYEEFITKGNIRVEYLKYKQKIQSEDEFAFSFIESVKSHYLKSSQQEKNCVYNDIKCLFDCCVEYRIAISPE